MLILHFLFLITRAEHQRFPGFPHPAVAAVPVLAETGGTGQETGEGDPASRPAAGAATTAGYPETHTTNTCQ